MLCKLLVNYTALLIEAKALFLTTKCIYFSFFTILSITITQFSNFLLVEIVSISINALLPMAYKGVKAVFKKIRNYRLNEIFNGCVDLFFIVENLPSKEVVVEKIMFVGNKTIYWGL